VARSLSLLVGLLILGFACALIGAGSVLLAEAISFANGCKDECHAAAFWGGLGIFLLGCGLLVLLVSALVLGSARAYPRANRERDG
jgi:hypothetical protein